MSVSLDIYEGILTSSHNAFITLNPYPMNVELIHLSQFDVRQYILFKKNC